MSYWATETVNLTGNGFTIISSYTGETIHGFTFYESIVSFNIPGSINLNCGGEMDELRFYPYEATATTYNYSPIIGISEVLDENNYLSYFEYDDFSRLQYSEDHFGNGLSYTDYHFRNSNIPSDQNYVRTEIATIPGLSRLSLAAATLTNVQSRRSFTFIDGLARPIQQLQVGQSPSGKDIVTYLEYDAYGRQPKTYLPFTTSQSPGQYKNDAKADQLDFYSTGLEWSKQHIRLRKQRMSIHLQAESEKKQIRVKPGKWETIIFNTTIGVTMLMKSGFYCKHKCGRMEGNHFLCSRYFNSFRNNG